MPDSTIIIAFMANLVRARASEEGVHLLSVDILYPF
jgi:predicted xylose isomerase-like sugar epimerase